MTTVNIPQYARKALKTSQWMRNNLYVDAYVQSFLAEETNRICRWRTKAISFSTPIDAIPAVTGTSRSRWRAVYRATTFAKYLWIKFELARCNLGAGAGGATGDPFGKLLVQDSGGATVGTAEFHYGANPGVTVSDVPSEWGTGYVAITSGGSIVSLTPGTDYYLTVSDEQGARVISACVYEESAAGDTANGYLDGGVAAGGPIYDEDRGDMVTMLRDAWKHNAAGIWYWASHTDATAPSRTTNTGANLIDQTVGFSAASHPGVTIDLANRSTIRRGTVPCAWYVYAKQAAGTGGTMKLVGISGGILATLTITSTTAQWYSTTVNLAASSDRWGLLVAGNNVNATTFYASSLFQYEA